MKQAKFAFLMLLIFGILLYYRFDLSKAENQWATAGGKDLHVTVHEAGH